MVHGAGCTRQAARAPSFNVGVVGRYGENGRNSNHGITHVVIQQRTVHYAAKSRTFLGDGCWARGNSLAATLFTRCWPSGADTHAMHCVRLLLCIGKNDYRQAHWAFGRSHSGRR